jgi:hypothetical protein
MSSPMAGFAAVSWARDDYQEFAQRSANKSNELFWTPSKSLGRNGGTMANSLFYYYYPSPGFNWCEGSRCVSLLSGMLCTSPEPPPLCTPGLLVCHSRVTGSASHAVLAAPLCAATRPSRMTPPSRSTT